jgi:serine/threonine-protein kinase
MTVRKVGSCRILREIGRGGMGVIYEAYQDGLDRRVAVKALEAQHARYKDHAERFRREGRAYAQICHDAIPTVHDLVEKDEALYLVTEYVDGADVRELLRAGPLAAESVAAIGARLADALDCVHFHGLLHRDVKPANVMVTRSGEVKLMDFGVAKDPLASELTRTGMLVGTPAYVAPEVLEGDPASEKSDIWAAGVALYEIACGTRPFQGDSLPELFAAVRRARPRRLRAMQPGFPRRLAKVIERCLEKRPSRRWHTAGELALELDRCAHALLDGERPQERLAALVAERWPADAPLRVHGADEGDGDETPIPTPVPASRRRFGARARRLAWALAAVVALAGAWWAGAAYTP